MKRLVGTVLGLAVVVLVLFLPAAIYGVSLDDGAGPETTTITSYRADFEVGDDGSMDVVETLAVDFPGSGKHGIFRFWDVSDPNAPHARRIPEDISVTRDGRPEDFTLTSEDLGRYRVAKIGSASRFLTPGEHVYVLRYTIDDVLIEGDGDGSRFYWNLVPGGWRQPIDRVELAVQLPAETGDTRCAVGSGETGGCDVIGEGGTTLRISTGGLAPNTPVTVETALDVPVPPTQGTTRPWAPEYDAVLGRPLALGLVLLLAIAAGAWGAVLGARSREDNPGFPLMYAPPEGIGPAQAQYIRTEGVDRETYVATLMYAAERDAIELGKQGRSWTITDKNGPSGWAGLDPVTGTVAKLLHGPGSTFVADPGKASSGKKLKTQLEAFESETTSWAAGSGLMVRSGLGSLGRMAVLAGFAAVLAFAIFNPLEMSMLGLVPGAFAVCGFSLVRQGSGTKRTRAGRDLWSRVGGFHRILSTPSAQDRFEFSGRRELYTAYLPWAVAFGCADAWTEKYRVEVGEDPPMPDYLGRAWIGSSIASSVDTMVGDFSSTLGSAISSYEATQSSSSSGGGGFSGGGGGGGGGGGSW